MSMPARGIHSSVAAPPDDIAGALRTHGPNHLLDLTDKATVSSSSRCTQARDAVAARRRSRGSCASACDYARSELTAPRV